MAQEVPHRSQWYDRHASPPRLPHTSKGSRAQAVAAVEVDPRGLPVSTRSADNSGVPRQLRNSSSQRSLEDSKERIRGTWAGSQGDAKERQRRLAEKTVCPQATRKKSGSPVARRPIRHTSALWLQNDDKPSAAEPLGEDQQHLLSSVHGLLQKACSSFEERLKNLEQRTGGQGCIEEPSSVVPKSSRGPDNDSSMLERETKMIHRYCEKRYDGVQWGKSHEISQSSVYEARFKAIEAVIEENMPALDIIPWLQSRVCAMDKLLQEVQVQAGSMPLNTKGGAADLAEPELTGQSNGERPHVVEQASGSLVSRENVRLSDLAIRCQVLEPRFDNLSSRVSSLEGKDKQRDTNLESLWASNDAVASWIEKFDVEMNGVQRFVTAQVGNLQDHVGRIVGSSPFSVTIQSATGFQSFHPHLCCAMEVIGKAGSQFETQAACGTFETVWNESYELLDLGLHESLQFRIVDKQPDLMGPLRSVVLGEATLSGKDIFADGFGGVLKLSSGSSFELDLHLTIVRLGLSAQHAKLRELEASCNDVWKVIPNIRGSFHTEQASELGSIPESKAVRSFTSKLQHSQQPEF